MKMFDDDNNKKLQQKNDSSITQNSSTQFPSQSTTSSDNQQFIDSFFNSFYGTRLVHDPSNELHVFNVIEEKIDKFIHECQLKQINLASHDYQFLAHQIESVAQVYFNNKKFIAAEKKCLKAIKLREAAMQCQNDNRNLMDCGHLKQLYWLLKECYQSQNKHVDAVNAIKKGFDGYFNFSLNLKTSIDKEYESHYQQLIIDTQIVIDEFIKIRIDNALLTDFIFYLINETQKHIRIYEQQLKEHNSDNNKVFQSMLAIAHAFYAHCCTYIYGKEHAIKAYLNALNYTHTISSPSWQHVVSINKTLGLLYFENKENNKSIECFENAITHLEKQLKSNENNKHKLYSYLIECYDLLNKIYDKNNQKQEAILALCHQLSFNANRLKLHENIPTIKDIIELGAQMIKVMRYYFTKDKTNYPLKNKIRSQFGNPFNYFPLFTDQITFIFDFMNPTNFDLLKQINDDFIPLLDHFLSDILLEDISCIKENYQLIEDFLFNLRRISQELDRNLISLKHDINISAFSMQAHLTNIWCHNIIDEHLLLINKSITLTLMYGADCLDSPSHNKITSELSKGILEIIIAYKLRLTAKLNNNSDDNLRMFLLDISYCEIKAYAQFALISIKCNKVQDGLIDFLLAITKFSKIISKEDDYKQLATMFNNMIKYYLAEDDFKLFFKSALNCFNATEFSLTQQLAFMAAQKIIINLPDNEKNKLLKTFQIELYNLIKQDSYKTIQIKNFVVGFFSQLYGIPQATTKVTRASKDNVSTLENCNASTKLSSSAEAVRSSNPKTTQTQTSAPTQNPLSEEQQALIQQHREFINFATKIFLKNLWSIENSTIITNKLEFKDRITIADHLLKWRRKNSTEQIVSLTFSAPNFYEQLRNLFIDMLLQIYDKSTLIIKDEVIQINVKNLPAKDIANQKVDKLLLSIFKLADEFQTKTPQDILKDLRHQGKIHYQTIKSVQSDTITTLLFSYNQRIDKSKFTPIIERAKKRANNTKGEFKSIAEKVVKISEKITTTLFQHTSQWHEINTQSSELITKFEQFESKLDTLTNARHQNKVNAISNEDIQSYEQLLKALAVNSALLTQLTSSILGTGYDSLFKQLKNDCDEYINKFDKSEDQKLTTSKTKTQNDQSKTKQSTQSHYKKNKMNTALDSINDIEKKSIPLKTKDVNSKQPVTTTKDKLKTSTLTLTNSESTNNNIVPVAIPKQKSTFQVIVHNSEMGKNLEQKNAEQSTSAENKQKQTITVSQAQNFQSLSLFAAKTTPMTRQTASSLSNEQLIEQLQKYRQLIRQQSEKYFTVKREQQQGVNMIEMRYSMQLNLFHYCHGIWLIVIALKDQISEITFDHKKACLEVTKTVRNMRSILVKLPKNFDLDTLFETANILLSDKYFDLVRQFAQPLDHDKLLKLMRTIVVVINMTELYKALKNTLNNESESSIVKEKPASVIQQEALDALLQIGEAMHIIQSLGKGQVDFKADFMINSDHINMTKMLIIVIGKYAEQLSNSHNHIFQRLQQEVNIKYFNVAIEISKKLRHPLANKNPELTKEELWKLYLKTVDDNVTKIANKLIENANNYIEEKSKQQLRRMC